MAAWPLRSASGMSSRIRSPRELGCARRQPEVGEQPVLEFFVRHLLPDPLPAVLRVLRFSRTQLLTPSKQEEDDRAANQERCLCCQQRHRKFEFNIDHVRPRDHYIGAPDRVISERKRNPPRINPMVHASNRWSSGFASAMGI
jgi:hypothetical protein